VARARKITTRTAVRYLTGWATVRTAGMRVRCTRSGYRRRPSPRPRARLLPCRYYLLAFTLPAPLRPLALAHQRKIYGCLMRAAAPKCATTAVGAVPAGNHSIKPKLCWQDLVQPKILSRLPRQNLLIQYSLCKLRVLDPSEASFYSQTGSRNPISSENG
jgi:hypothetical protein